MDIYHVEEVEVEVVEMIDWVLVVQDEFVVEDIENVDCSYYSHDDDDDWDIEMKEDVDKMKVAEMKMNYYYEEALVDDWMKRMLKLLLLVLV